ncbi:hypothetical protein SUGI_0720570 [Cryptomeria japonica]|nr:hypothetical protein SUGI_0720570 [Cryptomeria japonica]
MESKKAVNAKIDPDRWIIQVRDNLQREEEEEGGVRVSVFKVPKEALQAKPEAYTPQCVSIGPYHHWKSELYEMEGYKLGAARAFQKRIDGNRFESVVEEVRKYERRMRSCYHKYLDYSGETLAWIMALDASFVLECTQFLASHDSSEGNGVSKLLDPSGRSATHNAIVRDMMMLENQLPLFLLEKMLEMELGSQDMAEERLCDLVRGACIDMSPFLFNFPDSSRLRITESSHLLEALYFSLVQSALKDDLNAKGSEEEQRPSPNISSIPQEFSFLWRAFHSFKMGPMGKFMGSFLRFIINLPFRVLCVLGKLLKQSFVRLTRKLPFRVPSVVGKLAVLRAFKWLLTLISGFKEAGEAGEGSSSVEIPPTRDELDIPCVADLYYAGVKFLPTDGDLTTIRFDSASATLYLPKLRLDSNTEVIIRNLVAFKASVASGDLIFVRYTDFMNGIIDTDEDVRLLISSGILYHHLESDGNVASLWNGMGKCVKLTKVKFLDKVIADVNSYYKRTWSVAMTFCSFFNCRFQLKDTNLLQD